MAERLRPVAVATIQAATVTADDRVLDVATGTGNAALVASERGAEVLGVDFESALLDIARARAVDSGGAGAMGSRRRNHDSGGGCVGKCRGVGVRCDVRLRPRSRGTRIDPLRRARDGRIGWLVGAGQLHACDGTSARRVPAAASCRQRTAEPVGRSVSARRVVRSLRIPRGGTFDEHADDDVRRRGGSDRLPDSHGQRDRGTGATHRGTALVGAANRGSAAGRRPRSHSSEQFQIDFDYLLATITAQ